MGCINTHLVGTDRRRAASLGDNRRTSLVSAPWPCISSSAVLFASSPAPVQSFSRLSPSRPCAAVHARGARLRAALGIALGGASRGRSCGLMHAECSRRRPTCTGNDRSGLPASRLQLQRSSQVRCTRTPRLCACTILHE